MHISFASPARYPGTSGDHGQTRSSKAEKSPTNIHRLRRRAGYFQCQVPALIPQENPNKVLAQISSPNDHHQATVATPYMSPASRGCQHAQIPRTITTSALLLPRYPGARDTNNWCISSKMISINDHTKFWVVQETDFAKRFLFHYLGLEVYQASNLCGGFYWCTQATG